MRTPNHPLLPDANLSSQMNYGAGLQAITTPCDFYIVFYPDSTLHQFRHIRFGMYLGRIPCRKKKPSKYSIILLAYHNITPKLVLYADIVCKISIRKPFRCGPILARDLGCDHPSYCFSAVHSYQNLILDQYIGLDTNHAYALGMPCPV